jgi:transcriptional regulator with GAF, ATPase, and Fis domain
MELPLRAPVSAVATCYILIVEDEFLIADDLALILGEAGYPVIGIADSVAKALNLMERQRPDMVLLDIYLKGKATGIDLARLLEDENIPFIYISANDNRSVLEEVKTTRPCGYLVKPFRQKDLLTTLEISRYRHAHSVETKLREEKTLQVALTDALSEPGNWEQKLLEAAVLLQPHIPFDYLTIRHRQPEADRNFQYYRVGFAEYQTIEGADLQRLAQLAPDQLLRLQTDAAYEGVRRYNGDAFVTLREANGYVDVLAKTFRLESALVLPLEVAQNNRFVVTFLSRKPDTYLSRHLGLLERLEQPLVLMLDRVLAFEEVARLSEQLQQEKNYLQEEVKITANFEEIIGKSPNLLRVFSMVTQVAPTNANVLILGESGTGKELIARAIHNLSPRKDKILVKINCAALPATLIESELFGHEKGAFTGALDKRIGKFELAHRGTVFLDEIGEMPLELQAKLLRVLQEKEIERIGGKTTIQADVRVIAATNRPLEKEVAEGRFRLDLYYRLNVFPIFLPALRERSSDIPLLAHFFAQKAARKLGKPFLGISEAAMQQMMQYPWPGNIRELENVIARAAIVHDGKTLLTLNQPLPNGFPAGEIPVSLPAGPGLQPPSIQAKDLYNVKQVQQETEREFILAALQRANGRIRGEGGAAELLNMKPSTPRAATRFLKPGPPGGLPEPPYCHPGRTPRHDSPRSPCQQFQVLPLPTSYSYAALFLIPFPVGATFTDPASRLPASPIHSQNPSR